MTDNERSQGICGPYEPFFHVGVIVADVDEARRAFRELLGVEFHDSLRFDAPAVDDGETRSVTVEACFSVNGPPYFEILKGDGKGIYACEGRWALHHVGLWTASCVDSLRRASALGVRSEAVMRDDSGQPEFLFTDPADTVGIRFEVVDAANREAFETMMRTGTFPT